MIERACKEEFKVRLIKLSGPVKRLITRSLINDHFFHNFLIVGDDLKEICPGI